METELKVGCPPTSVIDFNPKFVDGHSFQVRIGESQVEMRIRWNTYYKTLDIRYVGLNLDSFKKLGIDVKLNDKSLRYRYLRAYAQSKKNKKKIQLEKRIKEWDTSPWHAELCELKTFLPKNWVARLNKTKEEFLDSNVQLGIVCKATVKDSNNVDVGMTFDISYYEDRRGRSKAPEKSIIYSLVGEFDDKQKFLDHNSFCGQRISSTPRKMKTVFTKMSEVLNEGMYTRNHKISLKIKDAQKVLALSSLLGSPVEKCTHGRYRFTQKQSINGYMNGYVDFMVRERDGEFQIQPCTTGYMTPEQYLAFLNSIK